MRLTFLFLALLSSWATVAHASSRSSGNRGAAEAWVESFSSTKSHSSRQRLSGNNKSGGQPSQLTISKHTFASSIAFLTGVADVFSFRMNRCYASMLTGNAIQFASAIGELRLGDALYFAATILCYAMGSTLYRTLVHLNQAKVNPHASARFSASPLIILAFFVSDLVFYRRSLGTELLGHVLPLSLGFGILNSASTDALGGTITFAYTGHVGKMAQGMSDWLFAVEPRKRRFKSATKLSTRVLGFFLMGAIVGTLISTAGTQHIVMPASGLTMAAFLVAQQQQHQYKVPLFTILGALSVVLIHLYDRPLPNNLLDILPTNLFGGRRRQKSKIDVSVNSLWFW